MQADIDGERALFRFLGRGAKKVLPRMMVQWIQHIRGRPPHEIPLGSVRFGDLRRFSPIGRNFGWERGTPIDRYYIERFLARNAGDIHGRVLELAESSYTQRFGGAGVERSDVLSIEATNPASTIVGDITNANTLPEAAFDCIIFTQALQLIFDLRATVSTLCRALKPGGVLLVTTPGVTLMDAKEWTWYWAFTAASIRNLLSDQFGQDAVSVEAHGNIFAATAFLYGLAIEELDQTDLDLDDSRYPVIVAARVVKR